MPPVNKDNRNELDVAKVVNDILFSAVDQGASDVHLEPLEDKMIVRFRIDGVLSIMFETDLDLYHSMVSRIKVMAEMELTGLPRPQEGNIKLDYNGRRIDLRVSIFPTSTGEVIVIRLLEGGHGLDDYLDLGFTEEQIQILESITHRPYGLVLVTGPTGSGKSTTLFTMLSKLNSAERSLVTLEDPVERKIEMVRQTEINPQIGLTFAEGLRYLLRQDPDIIMVGEIRDKETAQIAVRAAVTGHLVLATIHTNNAAGAIIRLLNMGNEPFLLASALKFVSAQRLARRLCPDCREEYHPPEDLIKRLDIPPGIKFYNSVGCDNCNQRGTEGRIGIHEILLIDDKIKELILTNPSDEQINITAIRGGMSTLWQNALKRVDEGVISLQEAIRLVQ